MARYVVDGVPLLDDEASRHRAACNAALSGILAASPEEPCEGGVDRALGFADELVRQIRRRVEVAYTVREVEPAAYRLVEEDEMIARWVDGDLDLTIPRNLALGRLRKLAFPMTLKDVAASGLRHDMVRELVEAGILVPAEEARDAA